MALFCSLILLVFGALISYTQRFNDQQFTQMQAFRLALHQACAYNVTSGDQLNPGASVQYTVIENRRHADLNSGFMKGNSQTLSASSNVFWAVPEAGASAENLVAYKINDDERVLDSKEYENIFGAALSASGTPAADKDQYTLQTESPNISANSGFSEINTKGESPSGITNRRQSELTDNVHTEIPYTLRRKSDDEAVYSGTLWDATQQLYRDNQGQYKYSSRAADVPVEKIGRASCRERV